MSFVYVCCGFWFDIKSTKIGKNALFSIIRYFILRFATKNQSHVLFNPDRFVLMSAFYDIFFSLHIVFYIHSLPHVMVTLGFWYLNTYNQHCGTCFK